MAFLFSITVGAMTTASAAPAFHRVTSPSHAPEFKQLERFTTSRGETVTLYTNGFATIEDSKTHRPVLRYLGGLAGFSRVPVAPSQAEVMAALHAPANDLYIPRTVVAVLRPGMRLADDDVRPSAERLAAMRTIVTQRNLQSVLASPALASKTFAYSNDALLNRVLSAFMVAHAHKVFGATASSRLSAMASRVSSALPIQNTYVFTIANGSVRDAVTALNQVPGVLYASPDFRVTTTNIPTMPVPKAAIAWAKSKAFAPRHQLRASIGTTSPSEIPTNFDVAYSGQSMLNAPGVNALAAYDEIVSKYHELPGTGEIITNVSIGDLDDVSALSNSSNPCGTWMSALSVAPTTEIIGGQRYLNLPALPLIPTYTADTDGNLNPLGQVCGADPSDGEIDLDFSVMAPLPDNQQRAGERGSGLNDLLGVAPGAKYRLVVPESPTAGAPDIAGALVGAAMQQPAPNVITASLGWGDDSYGFPSRYLEEDPLLRSVIAGIVSQGIVVCIASGDGLRTYTNAAVNPSGGTVPFESVTSGGTTLDDDNFSTTPSRIVDTGSIAVGGSTLDDVTAAPPYEAQFAKYRDQLAFPELRWDGFGDFASAYGSRVNLSAPSDNIIVTSQGGGIGLSGGTSAASPQVAAAAAVALQVARLTGKPFTSATALRSFLIAHANKIPNVPQADQDIAVGPQVDVTRTVEALLAQGGVHLTPHVSRVAIAQRDPVNASDFGFLTVTDPAEMYLSIAPNDEYFETGYMMYQPITIAPDWEGMPDGAKFRLFVTGRAARVLDTNRYARLYPSALLKAAGLQLYSASTRTVNLTYQATVGFRTIAEASVALTFLPNTTELHGMGPAPVVAPVTNGQTMPVSYDISNVDLTFEQDPTLTISYPGRTSTAQPGYKALYQVKLTQPKGTIDVPISALQGDGIYGIAITFNFTDGGEEYSDSSTWAYTRVQTGGTTRPAAPLLSSSYQTVPGHYIDVPYGTSFNVAWDVSNVPKANGATLEISAAGPNLRTSYNTFNNPYGSKVDDNGVDSGSQYTIRVSGTKGQTAISSSQLMPSEFQSIRVIPTDGSTVVSESGYQSMIATHGIAPADGGNVLGGFSVNPNGTDGVVMSNQWTSSYPGASYTLVSSIEAFDQKSNSISSLIGQENGATTNLWGALGNVNSYFNVWGAGIDPASDQLYFGTYPGYRANCPNPGCPFGYYSNQVNWVASVSPWASASPSPRGPLPQVVPSPVASGVGSLMGGNGGYSLGVDASCGCDGQPKLIKIVPPVSGTTPTLGTSYSLTNLNGQNVAGLDVGGGYAAALGTNFTTGAALIDTLDLSSGSEKAMTLGAEQYNIADGMFIDPDSQQIYFLSTLYRIGSPFWGYVNAYSVASGSESFPPLNLNTLFPVAMADLGNGWLGILSDYGPNVTLDQNAISTLQIVNLSTGADYQLAVSNMLSVGSKLESFANVSAVAGLPSMNNLIRANPNTNTIYIPGSLGTEIAPISIQSLGIDLRGAHR